jgi:hypothetical protein
MQPALHELCAAYRSSISSEILTTKNALERWSALLPVTLLRLFSLHFSEFVSAAKQQGKLEYQVRSSSATKRAVTIAVVMLPPRVAGFTSHSESGIRRS